MSKTLFNSRRAILLLSASCCAFPLHSLAGTAQISSDPFDNPDSQHMTEVEPHIFGYGSTLVAAFQQGRYFGGGCSDIGFATSVDSGATWRSGSLPGLTIYVGGDRYVSVSDPAVVYDVAHGIWMVVSLPVARDGILFVSRSSDGLSWDNPVTAGPATSNTFFDKPWITCDNSPDSRFFGNCYIEWDDVTDGGTVLMSTSTDGGATWGRALPTTDSATGLGGQPLVQPNGRVVVPFMSSQGEIRAFSSENGGESWNESLLVASPPSHPVAGELRALTTLPSAAIDGDGTIYVAWADCRFRSSCRSNDIVISTSSDGVAWSDVVRVPIDSTSSSADHFIPGLGVDRNSFAPNVHLGLVYYYYPEANCSFETCQLTGGFITSQDGLGGWSTPRNVTEPMAISWIADTGSGRMVGDYTSTYYSDDGIPHPVFATAFRPVDQFNEAIFSTCTGCVLPLVVETPSADEAPQRQGKEGALQLFAPTNRINIGTSLQIYARRGTTTTNTLGWSVEGAAVGGTVSDTGVFKAPLAPGVFHVVASDGLQQGRLTIEVFTVQ